MSAAVLGVLVACGVMVPTCLIGAFGDWRDGRKLRKALKEPLA